MASGAGFTMSRNFERDVKRAVQGAVKDIAGEYQKMFDSLLRCYKGRPVSQIKPVLRREWSRVGGSISDPELTEYATHISEGTRIKMRVR